MRWQGLCISLAICVSLAACSAASPIAPQLSSKGVATAEREALLGTFSGHLYVADNYGVERFPITNGIPATRPDLRYAGVTPPIALDSTNHLYATSGFNIIVYLPGSTRVARTLHVVSPSNVGIIEEIAIIGLVKSLVIDRAGHLFVGLGVRFCRAGSVGCSGPWFAKGVFVYAPNASGSPKPGFTFARQCESGFGGYFQAFHDFGGLALDTLGDLIVATSTCQNGVYTIGPPLGQGFVLRIVTGAAVQNPNGVALDSSGVLYVNNPNGNHSFIAAFPVIANGNIVPRVISIVGEKSFGHGIAAAAGRLFVPDPLNNAVYEISSLGSGAHTPVILHIDSGSPTDVKFGP